MTPLYIRIKNLTKKGLTPFLLLVYCNYRANTGKTLRPLFPAPAADPPTTMV